MDTYYLHTEHMDVGYDNKPLIRDIGIGVKRGEILTLIGPNGSGKSTILKSIIRQLKLLAGVVVLDRHAMAGMKESEIAKKMAIVMTERIRAELMTGYDVVATGRYPYTGLLGILSGEDRKKTQEAIELVHAQDYCGQQFTQMSDGQRQRLLLARAVCQEPEVIVLDEPTSFLDIRHKLELLEILKKLARERNVAVILSLHELDLAQKISDTVVCVAENGVDRWGTPEEIFQSDYITRLYGMEKGSYSALYGSLEMPRVPGTPRLFVIGGGGCVSVYRMLQRRDVPFAAGILQENDADWAAAKALAEEVVSVPAFSVPGQEEMDRARALMQKTKKVLCAVHAFGETNRTNRILRDEAEAKGWLLSLERLPELWTGGGQA